MACRGGVCRPMKEILQYLNTPRGATAAAVIAVVATTICIIMMLYGINFITLLVKIMHNTSSGIGKIINRKETKYNRDLEIGKINKKRTRYKLYKLLNDLTIDLGLKRQGVTPYELLFLLMVFSAVISIIIGSVLFDSLMVTILAYPIILAGITCTFYTKANVAHDLRIEAVIEAENIICNNISKGVVKAVKDSLDAIPKEIRQEFKEFIDNIEHENYFIKTALLDLNNKLGSIADDFISKCIVFELEEQRGIVGMFQDIVELNNIKTEARTDMKRKFERVKTQFIIGATMILVFLFGVIAVFPVVRNFYFNNIIGQLILIGDATIIVGEFVYITALRAQEL